MTNVNIGGNHYGHLADYLFAPSYGYGFDSYGYTNYGGNFNSPWYGSYPYYR